ncbi:alkaline phosphatase family protein [Leptospira sp. GIMC2001]|uniref:alkaline phosphatase family protein n=1 Tax=Leptospira sp. GIMC2001 TaxID=1513297 RepID=UPI002349C083|nr:alkaline phosphatase family protein [Leptospira sp. GIMC2001]WCL49541.1 alkaline phosphatase family protein [Leptospira sp. GIMC2001]
MRLLIILITISLSVFGCKDYSWEESYKLAASRSIVPEVDLVLVPEPFSNLDDEWIDVEKETVYKKEKLSKLLRTYGIGWSDFITIYKDKIKDRGNDIIFSGKGTTHATNYNYDANIPILFYGDKYVNNGIYQDTIYQQHIVPTVAELLESPVPNSVKLKSLSKILKKNSKPEIIVTIVIDQGGIQLYRAHNDSYPNIKKLMHNSAYFPNAMVGHIDAHTAVGHVAIGTGAFPNEHEIIANDRIYYKSINSNLTSVAEPIYQLPNGNISPSDMKSPTFADVWDQFNDNIPVIVSQCYAVRAAIGMAGHGSDYLYSPSFGYESKTSIVADKDFVYWLTKPTLSWTTHPGLYQLPDIANNFALYPFHSSRNPEGWDGFVPNSLDKMVKEFHRSVGNPTQSMLEGELIRSVIQKEIIDSGKSKDGYTDLVYVTFKATDATGHTHGWESEEAREVLEETDRQVGLIIQMLRNHYQEDFMLILTADHGAAPLIEFSGGRHMTYDRLLSEIQSLIPIESRNSNSLVNFYTSGQISLNKETMKIFGITEYDVIKRIKSIEIDKKLFFREVYSANELRKLDKNENK